MWYGWYSSSNYRFLFYDTRILNDASNLHVFDLTFLLTHLIPAYDDYYNPQVGDDGKPYATLSYANGPGYENHRMDKDGNEIPRINLTEIDTAVLSE